MNKQTDDVYDADCDRSEIKIPKIFTRLRGLNVTGPGEKYGKTLPELLIDMDSNENEDEQRPNENSNCKLFPNPVFKNFELTGSSDSDWM